MSFLLQFCYVVDLEFIWDVKIVHMEYLSIFANYSVRTSVPVLIEIRS